ncbi:MAG: hypothetical protein ACP5KA_07595, partial [Desulfurococcaceae archaeon]
MCFNVVVLSRKHKKTFSASTVLEVIKNQSYTNDDGFSAHAVDAGGQEHVIRTLSFGEFTEKLRELRKLRLLHVHFRAASCGAVTIENVHMFPVEVAGTVYRLSHNGHVGKFMVPQGVLLGEGCSTKSDTRMMVEDEDFVRALEKLILRGSPKKLIKYLKKADFYGVAFITSSDRVIAVSRKKPIHIYYEDNGLLWLVNTTLPLKKERKLTKTIVMVRTPYYASVENAVIDITDRRIRVARFREKPEYLK